MWEYVKKHKPRRACYVQRIRAVHYCCRTCIALRDHGPKLLFDDQRVTSATLYLGILPTSSVEVYYVLNNGAEG